MQYNKKEITMCQYPEEVFSSVRQTKTCCINSYLIMAKTEEGQRPYAIYDQRFSRYKITLIDTGNGKKFATANIKTGMIADLAERSRYAYHRHLDAESEPQAKGTSPAYTVRIASGTLKGKTPAEILLQDPVKGKELLQNQYKFLKENLSKYKGNKEQMDAIMDAAKLLERGELTGSTEKKQRPSISIYKADIKALDKKPRESDGMCPVYALSIQWNVGEKCPVMLDIQNYYAPVERLADGRINPKISMRDPASVVQIQYGMYAYEWMDAVRTIEANMRQFEVMTARACFDDARKTAKKLWDDSKSQA